MAKVPLSRHLLLGMFLCAHCSLYVHHCVDQTRAQCLDNFVLIFFFWQSMCSELKNLAQLNLFIFSPSTVSCFYVQKQYAPPTPTGTII